jgi:endonuclease-3
MKNNYFVSTQKRVSKMNRISKTIEVNETLKDLFPNASLELKFSTGFELLIAVILSAQCTDERVNVVTTQLFQKYRTPQDYLDVPIQELEQDIKPTGFYRNKAKALKACCQKLIDEFKGALPQEIEQFVKLPGVGRKTAAMVLGNAFGINHGIAVDTHVARVTIRLELTDQEKPDKIEQKLMAVIPQTDWTQFSNALILFGRKICQARKPKCPECPFMEWCPSRDKTI